jgi:hypothetical protein
LEAKREHPIAKKPTFLPAKKYSWVLVFLREVHQAIPPIAPKYTAITNQSQPTKVDSIVQEVASTRSKTTTKLVLFWNYGISGEFSND